MPMTPNRETIDPKPGMTPERAQQIAREIDYANSYEEGAQLILAAVKPLEEEVERLKMDRDAVQRQHDNLVTLNHRWNKMAAHFAAGSEFINDPERVLEALKSRQEMQLKVRDRYREQKDSAEARCKALEGLLKAAAYYVRLACCSPNPQAAGLEMEIRAALAPAPAEQEEEKA